MADHTKNISNIVNVFGNGPSTKWGQDSSFTTMVWGTSKWGEGESLPLVIEKYIDTGGVTLTDAYVREPQKVISESITPSMEMTSESLKNGDWNYVFTSDTTQAEDRDTATWTAVSEASTSFTSVSEASTTWTEG